jgi:metal-responsive CopG/Arc/MetJ family transcriptional regulator
MPSVEITTFRVRLGPRRRTSVIGVSMPEGLLDRVDRSGDDGGYAGRSELGREASRSLPGGVEDEKPEDRELMRVVAVGFDCGTTSVEERMMRLSHEHEGIVTSNFPVTSAATIVRSCSSWRARSEPSRRPSGGVAPPTIRSRSTTPCCRWTTSAHAPT